MFFGLYRSISSAILRMNSLSVYRFFLLSIIEKWQEMKKNYVYFSE